MTAVDLSRLPPPDVVEPLDPAAVEAAMTADFLARHPEHTAWVESDPAAKLIEAAAYREVLLRARINGAARAVMLASAAGADLDHIAAQFGVVRLAGEADDAMRHRVLLSHSAYSTAGSRAGYEFHARSADARVSDVAVARTAPGEVRVVVFGEGADGIPSAEVVAAVRAALTGEDAIPLTDTVTVQSVQIVPFTIDATLTLEAGPDRDVVLAAARASLADYARSLRTAGADVYRAAVTAAAVVPGVTNVVLAAPAADVAVAETQAPWCTSGASAPYVSPTTHPLDGITVRAA